MAWTADRAIAAVLLAVACVLGARGADAQTDDVPPVISRRVDAPFPSEARAAGLQGDVVLEFTVGTDGRVRDARVVEGIGHGFDEAALEAARQFEYRAATRAGAPIEARIRYRYRFRLPTAAVTPPSGTGGTTGSSSGTTPPARPRVAAVLRGIIRGREDAGIAGAVITLQREGHDPRTVETSADGAFRVEMNEIGRVHVTATASGYGEYGGHETLSDGDDLQVTYRLPRPGQRTASTGGGNPVPTGATRTSSAGATGQAVPSGRGGARRIDEEADENGITVRAARPQREVVRTTLDRREIARIPGTGGDAIRAIQNLPGVARPAFIGGQLIVRGAAPFDTQTFVDGTATPIIFHFGGLSSVIPTEMLDRIDFYPGNFSARFGRAMGGIVDVGIREPTRRGAHGAASIGIVDARAYVEAALGPNVSFAIAGRRSYIDLFLNALLSGFDSVPVIASPVYYDYQGVLDWRPNARNRVRLLLFGSDDALSVLFRQTESSEPQFAAGFTFGTRFHVAQLSWHHQIATGTSGRAMASFGWTNLGFNGGPFRVDVNTLPTNVRYELTHTFSPAVRLNTGLDMQFGAFNLDLSLAIPETRGGVIDTDTTRRIATTASTYFLRPAAYIEAELTPVRNLRIVPGVRFDYFRDINAATIVPRVSFRYEFVRSWAIRGGVGLFTQGPAPQESLNAPNAFFPGQSLGNPYLLPQRAMHYGLGIEHEFSPYITLTIDGFFKTMDDLVMQTPVLDARNATGVPPYTNDRDGRVWGMELLLRHRPSRYFYGWIAYTLMRSERRDGPNADWRLFENDQTHILTVLGTFTLPAGWEIGARFRLVSGNPFTCVVGANLIGESSTSRLCPRGIGSLYNADNGGYSGIPGPTYGQRLSAFHQLDIRIDKTWTFPTWRFGIFLEVLNVYNRGNPEGTQDNYNSTQFQFLNGLPIVPNLGVRGEF